MPSRDTKDLHPAMQDFWRTLEPLAERRFGYDVFLTCTHRTNAEQTKLWQQGRPHGLIVTNARAGQSPHNVAPPQGSHALDFAVMVNGKLSWAAPHYIRVASIARELGADPGAFWRNFPDNPHIQMPNWSIGKTYPMDYRFVKALKQTVKAAPKPDHIERPIFVFDAGDNSLIGYGTLIMSKNGGNKVYVIGDLETKFERTVAPRSNATAQARGFDAKTNQPIGVVTVVGDKVYLKPKQADAVNP